MPTCHECGIKMAIHQDGPPRDRLLSRGRTERRRSVQRLVSLLWVMKNVILEIEIQGALKVKEKIKDAVLMFVTAPDAGTLRDRLVGRGTETPEVIAARLARACEESEGIENYDYLVVNDTVDHASALIDQLICDEQSQNTGRDQEYRVSANIDFINQMRENLKSFSKGE